jgi:hypothetical protein
MIKFIIFHPTFYSTVIASNLQLSIHAPQRVHLLLSIVWAFFFSPLVACVGHTLIHMPQPVHLSALML